MKPHGRGPHTLLLWALLAAGLLANSGCACLIHPIDPVKADRVEACHAVPNACRSHVYVFLLNGLDPFEWSNLRGVCDYLQELGFIKTYYGQMYHCLWFDGEIKRLHDEDPEARFVLVGFSYGANLARTLAQSVKKCDITIDLLVYVSGNTLKNCDKDRPENALKIVNILASGCIWNGADIDGTERIDVPEVWHFGSPTHPATLEKLACELTEVAARVKFEVPAEPALPNPADAGPTPKPVTVETSTEHDEWDFLKPVSELKMPEPKPDLTPPPAEEKVTVPEKVTSAAHPSWWKLR